MFKNNKQTKHEVEFSHRLFFNIHKTKPRKTAKQKRFKVVYPQTNKTKAKVEFRPFY